MINLSSGKTTSQDVKTGIRVRELGQTLETVLQTGRNGASETCDARRAAHRSSKNFNSRVPCGDGNT